MSYAYATEPSSASHVAAEAKASPVTTDHNAKVIPALHRAQFTPTQAAVIGRAKAFRDWINGKAAEVLKKRRAPILLAVIPEPPPEPAPSPSPSSIVARIAALQEELKQLDKLAKAERRKAELEDRQSLFVSINAIQRAVCKHYGITQIDLQSQRRTQNLVIPRFIAIWLCRRLTRRSLPEIGRKFGDRDHTSIHHATRRMEGMRKVDTSLDCLLQVFIKQLAPWELENCSSVSVACSQQNEAQQCNSTPAPI